MKKTLIAILGTLSVILTTLIIAMAVSVYWRKGVLKDCDCPTPAGITKTEREAGR